MVSHHYRKSQTKKTLTILTPEESVPYTSTCLKSLEPLYNKPTHCLPPT